MIFRPGLTLSVTSGKTWKGITVRRVISTDTEKIFDDNDQNNTSSFSTKFNPDSIDAFVKRDRRFETNLWRDHTVPFDIKIAGIPVKDFLKHQHRVQIYIYKKRHRPYGSICYERK